MIVEDTDNATINVCSLTIRYHRSYLLSSIAAVLIVVALRNLLNLCINKPHANILPLNIAKTADNKRMVVCDPNFVDTNKEHVFPSLISIEDVNTLYGDGSARNMDDMVTVNQIMK